MKLVCEFCDKIMVMNVVVGDYIPSVTSCGCEGEKRNANELRFARWLVEEMKKFGCSDGAMNDIKIILRKRLGQDL